MSFFTYILYSELLDQYYIGHTSDLEDRLFRHNNSGSKSTKKATDWKLMYKVCFSTRAEAMRWEKEIKNKKRKSFVEQLIQINDT